MKKTVNRIRELCRTLPEYHDIGVIVRTNREVRDLIGELLQVGVQASEEGGTAITDSAAVELVLSAITIADHPGDSVARFHLSHSPLAERFGLEPETDLNQRENAAAMQSAATELRSQLISEGYGPTVESLARDLIDKCTEREIHRLQHLVRIAYDSALHNEQWHLRPSKFVEYIRDEVKIGDQSSARVRVMTIHKAKGLEFDVVVLPMPLTTQGWSGLTPNVVVGRENPTKPIEIATRYANKEVRKLLPPKFQKLFDDNRQANVREAMCVMYVALTRAVHATHIVMSYGAKIDHQSPAGVLLATLCPDVDRQDGMIYEYGDPQWFEKTVDDDPEPPYNLDDFYLPENLTWNSNRISKEIRSGRGVQRTSPSRLEGGDTIQLGTVFERRDNHLGSARGRLLHGCFQKVNWLDDAIPRRDELLAHLQKIDPTWRTYDRVVDDFYKMIDQPNLKKMLSRGPYSESYLMEFSDPEQVVMEANRLEVHTERAFAVNLDQGLIRGVIDRLIFVYQGDRIIAADVVDFKTETIDRDKIHGHIENYRPQLDAYREAVSRFADLPLGKISTRLAFVETGQIINLEIAETTVEDPSKARRTRHAGSAKAPSPYRGRRSTGSAKTESRKQTQAETRRSAPPKPKSQSNPKSEPSPKPGKQQQTFWD